MGHNQLVSTSFNNPRVVSSWGSFELQLPISPWFCSARKPSSDPPNKIEARCDIRKNLATKIIQGILVDRSLSVNKKLPSPNNPPVWGLEKNKLFFGGSNSSHHLGLQNGSSKIKHVFYDQKYTAIFSKTMFQSWLHLSHVEGFFQGPSNIFLVYPIWHLSRHQCNQMSRIHQSQRLLKENDISCTSFLQLKKINKQMGDFFLRGFKKTMNNQWWMSLCVWFFSKFPPGWFSQFEFRKHGFAWFVGRLLLIQLFFKGSLIKPMSSQKRSSTCHQQRLPTNQPDSLWRLSITPLWRLMAVYWYVFLF